MKALIQMNKPRWWNTGCFNPVELTTHYSFLMHHYLRVFLALLFGFLATALHAGNIKVTITPTGAINAGAQWRVDGGVWRASGTTVKNLSNTVHQVEYRSVSGWIAPASASVTLTANNQTVSLTGIYGQAASVKINTTPAGQWRVNGGAWQASGATVGDLTPGNHSVEFGAVSGYTTVAAETISLTAGQALILDRTYEQMGRISMSLNPTSAQWRVNGGAWRAANTSVWLDAGTYTIDYSDVVDYADKQSETVTLAAGQLLNLTRSYTYTPAAISMRFTGDNGFGRWRVNGGAWLGNNATPNLPSGTYQIEYLDVPNYTAPPAETVTLAEAQILILNRAYVGQPSPLSVVLTPNAGKWRVNWGAWQESGAVLSLPPGSYTLSYQHLTDHADLPNETVTLSAGQATTLNRSFTYTPASLTVNLGGDDGGGRWRVDGGAWQISGANVSLSSGARLVEYLQLDGYYSPPAETITIAEQQNRTLARNYVIHPTSVAVILYPDTAQWRLNGGAWRASGTRAYVEPGTYTIEYSDLVDYADLPSESITLSSGQSPQLTRSYTYTPATISMDFSGDNGMGRWRVDGGPWMPGNMSKPVPSGSRVIEYLEVPGYVAPPTETLGIGERELIQVTRAYAAQPVAVSVTLTPAIARWRLDGGAWQASGATLTPDAGPHTIEYEHLEFHVAPEAEVINLTVPQNLSRNFTPGAGDLLVQSNPPLLGARGVAKWRIDGGPWRACGERRGVLPGTHTLEFMEVSGLDTPDSIQVEIVAGEAKEIEADFFMPHRLRFFINQDLTVGLTTEDLQARLSQYAAHLQTIWHRETARRFVFDPATDITVCTEDPFSWDHVGDDIPELGFEMWIYARLTDQPAFGTYGGNGGLDESGAGGAANLKWDCIHDPATLQADTPEMAQYWRQIDHITHEFEHSFGAGLGEYYSLPSLTDESGVEPIHPPVQLPAWETIDESSFWGKRLDFLTDPLLHDIYGQPSVGAPKSINALLDTVQFAATSKGVINNLFRADMFSSGGTESTPDLTRVKVRVVDAATGLMIPGATCRAWNRRVDGTLGTFEQNVIPAQASGEFEFAWTPLPARSAFSNWDNAKIVKAWAPGYAPVAEWATVYDAQKALTWELKNEFVITLEMTAE